MSAKPQTFQTLKNLDINRFVRSKETLNFSDPKLLNSGVLYVK